MTFGAHLIVKMTFGRWVIKIISHIPNRLMNLVLYAIFMTVDTSNLSCFMFG